VPTDNTNLPLGQVTGQPPPPAEEKPTVSTREGGIDFEEVTADLPRSRRSKPARIQVKQPETGRRPSRERRSATEEKPHRRLPALKKPSGSLPKLNGAALLARVRAAIGRPGFLARFFTVVLGAEAIAWVSASYLRGWAQVAIVAFAEVCVLYFMYKTLHDAYKPLSEIPPGTLLPTQGWPKWEYRIRRLYGNYAVPRLTKKERLAVEIDLLKQRLREITSYVDPTIWVGNWKGNAGKSFVSVIGGETMVDTIRRNVMLLFTSGNTKTSTAGDLANLQGRSTLTNREYVRRLEEFSSFRKLYHAVQGTEYGLRVIAGDPGGSTDDTTFTSAKYQQIFVNARDLTEFLWLDTGNDDVRKGSVTVTGLYQADVAAIPACVSAPQTLDKLDDTMLDYLRLAERYGRSYGKPEGERQEGQDIPVSEKILNAVIVINGVNYKEDLEHYMDFLPEMIRDEFQGAVLGIHWDDYLATVTKNIDYRLMQDQTLRDYLEFDVTCLEQAAKLRGIEIPPRHPAIRQGESRFGTIIKAAEA
jgi:hypothetical protein